MTYTLLPNTGESLGQTRPYIRDNFRILQTVLNQNHVNINDGGQGKHKFLQMPDQGSAPATAANEGGLYCKAVSGATRMFFRQENNGDEIQLTGITPGTYTPTISPSVGTAAGMNTFLPGGFQMASGFNTAIATNTNYTVTIPLTVTAIYSLNIQVWNTGNSGSGITLRSVTPGVGSTQFVFRYNSDTGATSTIYWNMVFT